MWTPITNCGKQVSIHSTVRERDGDQVKVYKIVEVEFDQFKLELISSDDPQQEISLQQTLNCKQLVDFHFEVEVNDHELTGN